VKAQLCQEEEIKQALNRLDPWIREGQAIQRTFVLKDFSRAMVFVNQVADLAEAANHHPDISISWNKVTLRLTTHSAGGLTPLDFDLAEKINQTA